MSMKPKTRLIDKRELSGDTVIWRYMNFTKFVWMLAENSLWFTRPFKFDDKWEGLGPPSYLRTFIQFANGSDKEIIEYFEQQERLVRCGYLVNCWHINESESDAMWRLYGLSPEGIAIKSTIDRVASCLDPH